MQSTKQMIGKVNKKDLVRTITGLSYFSTNIESVTCQIGFPAEQTPAINIAFSSDIYATKYHILRT